MQKMVMTLDEYKSEIKILQHKLPTNCELTCIGNTKINDRLQPYFMVTKKYHFEHFAVETYVNIQIKESGSGIEVQLYTQGNDTQGHTLLESVISGLESARDYILEDVEGFIDLK